MLHPCTERRISVFTQCSNCNTVFELSAEVLRAAGGQVRCGRCGQIFNGLARLAEDAGSFETGESAFEMEERADSILESSIVEQALQAAPEAEDDEDEYGSLQIARLQVLDFGQEKIVDESALEAPAADATAEEDPVTADEHAATAGEYPTIGDDSPAAAEKHADAALEFTLPPGELDRIFVESSVGVMPLQPKPVEPDIEVVRDDGPLIAGPGAVTAESFPALERAATGSSEAATRRAGSLALWSSAAVAAALCLVAQVVHHDREELSHGPLAPLLRAIYQRLGDPVADAPDLAAFQLRQWGVTGEATGDAILRVRASILNTTTQQQPFPLLRVTLADRFGTRIGTRDFAANEYLGKPIARPLAPGEKVDAVLNIVDPGKDAEGFEIDVCLAIEGKRIVCANDAAHS